jgi:hypothetical protein
MNEITNKDLQELKRQLDKWDLTFHKSCKDKTFHLKNGIVSILCKDHICYEMPFEDYQDIFWKACNGCKTKIDPNELSRKSGNKFFCGKCTI